MLHRKKKEMQIKNILKRDDNKSGFYFVVALIPRIEFLLNVLEHLNVVVEF